MKHLDLHILQSFPVSCLNRDDLNSPKTAIFGGVQRARVSSQSWKRAIRELAAEWLPCVNGRRTRLIVGALAKRLAEHSFPQETVPYLAEMAAAHLSKLDTKKDAEGYLKVKTLSFLSEQELDSITDTMGKNEDLKEAAVVLSTVLQSTGLEEEKQKKELEKAHKACEKHISKGMVAKAIKSVRLKDGADIALFGRMVADDHSLAVEGAAMVGHALSTHKVENEIDFFAAVDDLQPEEEAGAGMTGTLEYNSATYYRFVALNLDMLKDKDHLEILSEEERKGVVTAFVKATLMAVPGARKNSMNAATLPGFVLGIVREKGHPVQFVNAFEKPIRPQGYKSLFEASVEALKNEYDHLNAVWGLNEHELVCVSIPDESIFKFMNEVTAHVE